MLRIDGNSSLGLYSTLLCGISLPFSFSYSLTVWLPWLSRVCLNVSWSLVLCPLWWKKKKKNKKKKKKASASVQVCQWGERERHVEKVTGWVQILRLSKTFTMKESTYEWFTRTKVTLWTARTSWLPLYTHLLYPLSDQQVNQLASQIHLHQQKKIALSPLFLLLFLLLICRDSYIWVYECMSVCVCVCTCGGNHLTDRCGVK